MKAKESALEIKYRISLKELVFFYKLSWKINKHGIDELFHQWERITGKDDFGPAFFGKWFGRPAYASTWFESAGCLSHLSIAWIEQVLTSEVIEDLRRETSNFGQVACLLDFFHSPRQGLVMLFSGAGKILLEENFFAPSHPITNIVASCCKEMESKQEFIQFFNRSISLRRQGHNEVENKGTGFSTARLKDLKISSLKQVRENRMRGYLTPWNNPSLYSCTDQKNTQQGGDL